MSTFTVLLSTEIAAISELSMGSTFSIELDGDKLGAHVQLSEYHYGGDPDEDNETYEFVKEVEESDIEDIIDLLKAQFPDYTFEGSVEEW